MTRPSSVRQQPNMVNKTAKAAAKVSFEDFINLLNSPQRLAMLNLRAGFWRGIGLTIGAAVVVVMVGFLVYFMGGLPYIGDFLRQIDNALKSSPPR